MTITFRCEGCEKTVEAPDSAAGSRGKCPYCGHSSYIATPMSDEDAIPFSDGDAEDTDTSAETQKLIALDRQLLQAASGAPPVPLDQKEDLTSDDLHHLVVNYCTDVFNGNLERAEVAVGQLRNFKHTAIQAVDDFQSGRSEEPHLKAIPPKVLQGFLTELKKSIKGS